jgi:tripartite-type tricarboxylate transporter receptor subunit TctC
MRDDNGRDLMTLLRRTFFRVAAAALAVPAIARFAWAQSYPTRPVRIVTGFAPGSGADIIARLLGQSLSERLGTEFIVDNHPGVGGNSATEMVVNAEPDGQTLLMVGPSNAADATLYEKLGFDFRRDIAPVAALVRSPNVMMVGSSVAAQSVPEFVRLAKAKPGQLTMASAGVGTASHLAGEMFKRATGVEMVHVPFRGGAGAYDDLVAGRADIYFPPLISAREHIRSGALRALAVNSVPGIEASTWFGVGAPRNTPAGIVERLNWEINTAFAGARLAARIADLGGTVVAGSASDFGKLIADETEKWAKVITFPGTTLS